MNVSQITHLSGWGNYTRIHHANGETTISALTIKRLIARPEFAGFLHIHKRTVVNSTFVKRFVWSVEPPLRGFCQLEGANTLYPVARRRAVEVRSQYLLVNPAAHAAS